MRLKLIALVSFPISRWCSCCCISLKVNERFQFSKFNSLIVCSAVLSAPHSPIDFLNRIFFRSIRHTVGDVKSGRCARFDSLGANRQRRSVYGNQKISNHLHGCSVSWTGKRLLFVYLAWPFSNRFGSPNRFFLASFCTKYDSFHFTINFSSLLVVIIPKLPQLLNLISPFEFFILIVALGGFQSLFRWCPINQSKSELTSKRVQPTHFRWPALRRFLILESCFLRTFWANQIKPLPPLPHCSVRVLCAFLMPSYLVIEFASKSVSDLGNRIQCKLDVFRCNKWSFSHGKLFWQGHQLVSNR